MYTKQILPNGKVELLENGKPISDGTGFDPAYADTLVTGDALPAQTQVPPVPPTGLTDAPPGQPASRPGLLGFADKLDAVSNLAKQKRNASSLDLMAPYRGTLAASDFNGILGNLNRASDSTTSDLLKRTLAEATPSFDTITDASGAVYQVKVDPTTKEILGEPKKIFDGRPAASGGSGQSNVMTDNERALFTQFRNEPIVKDYNTILSKKLSVQQILQAGLGGPGDLATVYEFMKALDPTSVVRESEYDSAAKSGNIFAGSLARFNGLLNPKGGQLSPQVKQAFQSIIDAKFNVQSTLYDNTAKEYEGLAKRQGLNPDNVVIGYDNAAPSAKDGASGDADYEAYLKAIQ